LALEKKSAKKQADNQAESSKKKIKGTRTMAETIKEGNNLLNKST